MYLSKYRKSKNGFILVYTLLIAGICTTSALGGLKLQISIRDNNIKKIKELKKEDVVQRDREYLLTYIDSYINKNLSDISCSTIKVFMLTYGEQKFFYGNSYIKYIQEKDAFYLCIYKDGTFCREELYKYSVVAEKIRYIPVAHSYKEGVVNICLVQ